MGANPNGLPRKSNDREVWDLWFGFTVGATGAVTNLRKSKEIRSIARTANPGEYLVTLRGSWVELYDYSIKAIQAAAHNCQVTNDSSGATTPTLLFVTQQESAGVMGNADLTNGVKVKGCLTLCNSARGVQ